MYQRCWNNGGSSSTLSNLWGRYNIQADRREGHYKRIWSSFFLNIIGTTKSEFITPLRRHCRDFSICWSWNSKTWHVDIGHEWVWRARRFLQAAWSWVQNENTIRNLHQWIHNHNFRMLSTAIWSSWYVWWIAKGEGKSI